MKAVGKNIPASVTFRAHLGIHILLSLCLCLKYQVTQCYGQHTGSNQQIITHKINRSVCPLLQTIQCIPWIVCDAQPDLKVALRLLREHL